MKCNELSNNIMSELKNKENNLDKVIQIIQVGDRDDSNRYIRNKIKKLEELGIEYRLRKFKEEEMDNLKLYTLIKEANLHIIPTFIQLPLPKHLNEELVHLIDYSIDIDGFSYETLGRMVVGDSEKYPCTPLGIQTILESLTDLEGKDVLIINRSFHIGKALALMLLDKNCTVTIAHSKTKDLQNKINNSDIIVTAIGKAKYFNADSFKQGQIVIDVSINLDGNGKLCGDIDKEDYDKLSQKGVIFTEVPNGVGIMTTTSLMQQIKNM